MAEPGMLLVLDSTTQMLSNFFAGIYVPSTVNLFFGSTFRIKEVPIYKEVIKEVEKQIEVEIEKIKIVDKPVPYQVEVIVYKDNII